MIKKNFDQSTKKTGIKLSLIFLLILLVFTGSSCGKKDKEKPNKIPKEVKEKKWELILSVPMGEAIKYQMDINQEGGLLFTYTDKKRKGKTERHPEKLQHKTILDFTAARDDNVDIKWTLVDKNPINGKEKRNSISFMQVDKNSSVLMEDSHNFAMLFTILFSLPGKGVSFNEEWVHKFDTPLNEKGFVKSKIISMEEIDGVKYLKIRSEFEIKKESGSDFLYFKGKGDSLYDPGKQRFYSGSRSFSINSGKEQPGVSSKVKLELKGNIRFSLVEKTGGKSDKDKNR